MKKRNNFWISLLIGMGFTLLFNSGCRKDDNPVNPIVSSGYTTLGRTIIPNTITVFPPAIYAYEISKYELYGYGGWQYGPGVPCQKRLDIMPKGYSSQSVTKAADLLRFFTMTDIHLSDKETPTQAIYSGYKNVNLSCYSGAMLLTTQVLNAAVKTINVLILQMG